MGTSAMGLGSLAAQSSALQSGQDRLIQQARSEKAETDDAKIEKGSKEFESVLLGSWLQQAEQSFASVPGAEDDDEDEAGRDQVMNFGVQALSQSLAASGGIGIAKMVSKAMHAAAEKAYAQHAAPAETDSKQVDGKH
jgi:Rod binding domain-containing protein